MKYAILMLPGLLQYGRVFFATTITALLSTSPNLGTIYGWEMTGVDFIRSIYFYSKMTRMWVRNNKPFHILVEDTTLSSFNPC